MYGKYQAMYCYCNPESVNASEKASCSCYYLSSAKDLLFCTKTNDMVTCEKHSTFLKIFLFIILIFL